MTITNLEAANVHLDAAADSVSWLDFSYTQWGTRAYLTADGHSLAIDPAVAEKLAADRFQHYPSNDLNVVRYVSRW